MELHEYILILKPVEQLTVIISGEQYPTLSYIIPLIRSLQNSLRNNFPTTNVAIQLKITLIDVIDRRLGCIENNKIAAKATFIDPRFKKAAFGMEANADQAQKYVLEEFTKYLNNEEQSISKSIHEFQQQRNIEECNELWEHFDQKVHEHINMETLISSAIIKIKQYVELPYLERKFNLLEFWEDRKEIYKGTKYHLNI